MRSAKRSKISRPQSRSISPITIFAKFTWRFAQHQHKRQELNQAFGRLPNWLNAVANNNYIESLQTVIQKLHGCASTHVESVPVHEVFRGETVWQGDVEVFNLIGHSKAKRCYAWAERK